MKLARSKIVSSHSQASNNWRREILRVPTALSFPPSFGSLPHFFPQKKSCFHHHWKNSDRKREEIHHVFSCCLHLRAKLCCPLEKIKERSQLSAVQDPVHLCRGGALRAAHSSFLLLIRKASNGHRRNPDLIHSRPFSPITMEWQDCRYFQNKNGYFELKTSSFSILVHFLEGPFTPFLFLFECLNVCVKASPFAILIAQSMDWTMHILVISQHVFIALVNDVLGLACVFH